MILETSKVERKPRKKEVNITKLVSKLKYQKKDSALSLVSTNPVDIVGAKEVWIYNTNTRKMGKYIANDLTGLTVKGTSILNFSPHSAEKTLRKPKEQLAAIWHNWQWFNKYIWVEEIEIPVE